MFKGLANFGAIMKQAQQMGAKMQELNVTLKSKRVSGSSGGGLVEVEANGVGEVLRISIDPELLAKQDRELIEDLIPAAVNQATARAKQLHAESQQELSGGMPGLEDAFAKLSGEMPDTQ